ncbi:MAG: DUF6580 family putative transport protein [Bacteroidales bacterium]|nr:DUF6580 family putative transport protein [Bacteroidales bacterium]
MSKRIFTPVFFFTIGVIMLSIVLRLLPHWPNFTPIAAMALFAGAYLKRKELAFAIPVSAMLISDLFLGFHQTMIAVYVGFALIVGAGMLLRRHVHITTVVLASLGSSILFFLITNFAVWASGMVGYPMTGAGLMQSYVAAIPFFRNALMGDLLYNAVFFGSFYFVSRRYPAFAA